MGYPALDGPPIRGLRPFGTLLHAFRALGLATAEMATFEGFLLAHRGHRIVRLSDDGEEEWPRSRPLTRPARVRPSAVPARYRIACAKCDCNFTAASAARLFPSADHQVAAQDVATFRNVIGRADDDLYRLGGFPFENLTEIRRFVEAHHLHPLRVDVSRIRRSRLRSSSHGRWEPPAWAVEDRDDYLEPVPRALQPHLLALNHCEPEIRSRACVSLGASGDPRVLGYLRAALEDRDARVRVAATAAIGRLPGQRGLRALGRALLDHSEPVRTAAREAASRRGGDEAAALEQARSLRGPYREPGYGTRRFAKDAIAVALRDPLIARDAAIALSEYRHPPTFGLLRAVAASPDPWVRSIAAEIAPRDDARSHAILTALLADQHAAVVKAAARSLGERADVRTADALIGALSAKDENVVAESAAALGKLKVARSRAPLLEALRHPSRVVKTAVLGALASLGDRRSVEDIARALLDDDAVIRAAALGALSGIGGPEACAAIVRHSRQAPDDGERSVALWRLGSLLPAALAQETLLAALGDGEARIREVAARALANSDTSAVVSALVAAARGGDVAIVKGAWPLLIRVGDRSLEAVLAAGVDANSGDEMVAAYQACGNPRLAAAARRASRGRMLPASGHPTVRWGVR